MPEMYQKIKQSLVKQAKKKGKKVDIKKIKQIAAATNNKRKPDDPVYPGYDKKKNKDLKEAVHVFSKTYKDDEKCEPCFVIEKQRKYAPISVGDTAPEKKSYEYCLRLKSYESSSDSIHLGYFDSEDAAEALGKKLIKAIVDAKK